MNIISYHVGEVYIAVLHNDKKKCKSVQSLVRISDYETWTLINGKRDWEITLSEAGEDKVTTGTCSMDEYWRLGLSYIINDLTEYLTKHKTKNHGTPNRIN